MFRTQLKLTRLVPPLSLTLTLLAGSWGAARHLILPASSRPRVTANGYKDVKTRDLPTPPNQGRALLLRIGRGGFEPAALTIRPGEYSVVILNASHLQSMSITFDREGVERLDRNMLSRELNRWAFRTSLSPGNYVVTSSAHPNWVCRIQVTPT